MDIAKFFSSESKKRDHSSGSSSKDDSKKVKSNLTSSDASNEDIFEEGLDSSSCRDILFNCLKNLEEKVNGIYEQGRQNNESQIKGDKRLGELCKCVEFISGKFDEFEKDRKEKNECIKSLKEQVLSMERKIEQQSKSIELQEQYSRRNCVLVHGIKETKDEDTDKIVIDIISKDLDIIVDEKDLDRSHRIGRMASNLGKPRPIIVKFSRYNMRKKVFSSKKKLKGKNISITESLTSLRMEKLTKARNEYGFQNVWSSDGKILFKENGQGKAKVYFE